MSEQTTYRISHLAPPCSPVVEASLGTTAPGDRDVEPGRLFRTFVKDMPLTKTTGPALEDCAPRFPARFEN